MITDNEKIYKGKSAQLHVMSLLLLRGWNVAIPEVDTGDDVLVLKDESGDLRKVQVKSTYTILKDSKKSFQVKFNIPGKQLIKEQPVELTYFFIVLKNNSWHPQIIIIQRDQLEYQLGLLNKKATAKYINLYLDFNGKKVSSGSDNKIADFSPYINDFTLFPLQF